MVFGITHGAALTFFRLSNRPNEALGNWYSLMNSGSRNPTSSFMLSPVGRSPSSISSIMPKTLYAPLAADLDGMRTTFSTPSLCGIPFAKVGVKIYPVFPRLRYQVSFSPFLNERHPAPLSFASRIDRHGLLGAYIVVIRRNLFQIVDLHSVQSLMPCKSANACQQSFY